MSRSSSTTNIRVTDVLHSKRWSTGRAGNVEQPRKHREIKEIGEFHGAIRTGRSWRPGVLTRRSRRSGSRSSCSQGGQGDREDRGAILVFTGRSRRYGSRSRAHREVMEIGVFVNAQGVHGGPGGISVLTGRSWRSGSHPRVHREIEEIGKSFSCSQGQGDVGAVLGSQ
jgi:hypothetical protein